MLEENRVIGMKKKKERKAKGETGQKIKSEKERQKPFIVVSSTTRYRSARNTIDIRCKLIRFSISNVCTIFHKFYRGIYYTDKISICDLIEITYFYLV